MLLLHSNIIYCYSHCCTVIFTVGSQRADGMCSFLSVIPFPVTWNVWRSLKVFLYNLTKSHLFTTLCVWLCVQALTWRQSNTRTSASQFGMLAVRTRSDLCGDTTSRTHRYRRGTLRCRQVWGFSLSEERDVQVDLLQLCLRGHTWEVFFCDPSLIWSVVRYSSIVKSSFISSISSYLYIHTFFSSKSHRIE